MLPAFDAPAWAFKALIVIGLVGFPITMVLAWLYELTAQGLKRDEEVVWDKVALGRSRGAQQNALVIDVLVDHARSIFTATKVSRGGARLTPGSSSSGAVYGPVQLRTATRSSTARFDQALGVGLEGAPSSRTSASR